MASYVGDTIVIKVTAIDPFTNLPLVLGYTVTADCYVPSKRPKSVPADRATPDVAGVSCTWDPVTQAYYGYVSTVGTPWIAGNWSYRVTVAGALYKNVEFGSFKLLA